MKMGVISVISLAAILTVVSAAPGGWSSADSNDADLLDLLNEVYLDNSSHSGDEVAVTAIEQQVVSGMNYRFTLQLSQPPSDPLNCQVVIYTQAWTGTKRVSEDGCMF